MAQYQYNKIVTVIACVVAIARHRGGYCDGKSNEIEIEISK